MIDGKQKTIEYWQIKRDDTKRGIVEVIHNDSEQLRTLGNISTDQTFQKQIEKLREVETDPQNYRLSVSGFHAEIDRMNLEVREHQSIHPSELVGQVDGVRT